MNAKKILKKMLSLLIVFCMLVPNIGVFADDTVKVAFVGNATLLNRQKTPYPSVVSDYIEKTTGSAVSVITDEPIDFESDGYLDSLVENVAKQNPDMVFIEINISKLYSIKADELTRRLENAVKELAKADKVPAVYFVYTAEKSLNDYREPFDRVAEHYGIKVADTYSYFKSRFEQGLMRTSDFLTAGTIPSEDAHPTIGRIIVNTLMGEKDIFASSIDKLEPIYEGDYVKNEVAEVEPPIASEGEILYVDINSGNDTAAGTEDAPLKTLRGARDKVRELKSKLGDDFNGATVYLREGLYLVGESFELNENDSGTEDARVVYSAYPGEKVRVTNANLLDSKKFKLVTDKATLERIPAEGMGHVYMYDLNDEGISPGVHLKNAYNYGNQTNVKAFQLSRTIALGNILVANDKIGDKASYPNAGYALISEDTAKLRNRIDHSYMNCERWETAQNAWTKAITGQAYLISNIKIKAFDTSTKSFTLEANTSTSVNPGWWWSITNLLEELDSPNEWYADEFTGRLYYYPKGKMEDTEILFSSNYKPVISMSNTKYVTIKDITVEAACDTGIDIYEGYANTVDGCTLHSIGYAGVTVRNGVSGSGGNNAVINSHIYDTAAFGIRVDDGDRENLIPSGDYVENCHIERYGFMSHGYVGGVLSEGTVGFRVSHCNIHNAQSPALYMAGNDDFYEYNELYNVAKDTDDLGVIYGSEQGIVRQGVTFKHNFFHDNWCDFKQGHYKFVCGFYSDSTRNNGATVSNNVFVNQQDGIFFSNNHNMTATQNLFVDPVDRAIRGQAEFYTEDQIQSFEKYYAKMVEEENPIDKKYRGMDEGNYDKLGLGSTLFYRGYMKSTDFNERTKDTYYLKYPWLEHYLESNPERGGFCFIQDNAVFGSTGKDDPIDFPKEYKERYTVENNLLSKETILGDDVYERIDNAMKKSAEAIDGFEVWDARDAGMYSEPESVGDFNLTYPVNGAEEVDLNNLRLKWEYACGADSYEVEIASDPNFKNIVFRGTSRNNFIDPAGLESGAKTYYWRVRAASWSDRFVGSPENADGVYVFKTQRFATSDKTKLGLEIAAVNSMKAVMTEGTEPGQYPTGTVKELDEVLTEAEALFTKVNVGQTETDEMTRKLHKAYASALSKVILEEISAVDVFADWDKMKTHANDAEMIVTDGITIEKGERIEMTKTRIAFGKEYLGRHNILHGTIKFHFGDTLSDFGVIGLSADRNSVTRPWNPKNYFVLVTKTAIELQGYRTNANNIYLNIPNTFFEDGKEHDFELGAVPAENGDAVRVVFRVDGKVVFNYLDFENPILTDGYPMLYNSDSTGCYFEITKPKSQEYKSLLELLSDPESEIYVEQ